MKNTLFIVLLSYALLIIASCESPNKPVQLMDYIDALEKALGKKAKINFLPLQPGDVPDTYANIDNLKEKYNYQPSTSVIDGVSHFVDWYKDYYKI